MKNLDFAKTWTNKYKKIDGKLITNTKRLWYYVGLYKPAYVEKFPYSTTIFVSLTDNWHRWESININSIFLSFIFLVSIVNTNFIFVIIGLRMFYSLFFTFFFHKK